MIDDEFEHTKSRLSSLERAQYELKHRVDKLDDRTKEIAENTKEIVEILRGAKGLRSLIVWLTPVAVVVYWILDRVHFK